MSQNTHAIAVVEVGDDPLIPASEYDGKPRPARQHAYLHLAMKYPLPFTMPVPDEGPARPGLYLIAGNCFRTAQYGLDFVAKELRLVPLDTALAELSKKAAAK